MFINGMEGKVFLLVCLPRFRNFVPTYPLRAMRDQGNCSSTFQWFFFVKCFLWVPTQGIPEGQEIGLCLGQFGLYHHAKDQNFMRNLYKILDQFSVILLVMRRDR